MRLAVVLLYTAGLRRGELLRLTLADVDPRDGILQIRASKFHKSRIVPLSPDACRELRLYLRKRLRPPLSCSAEAPLLCNNMTRVRGYTGNGLRQGIQQLFRAANVCGTDGRTPRVHDFRHYVALRTMSRTLTNSPILAVNIGSPGIEVQSIRRHSLVQAISRPESSAADLPGDNDSASRAAMRFWRGPAPSSRVLLPNRSASFLAIHDRATWR